MGEDSIRSHKMFNKRANIYFWITDSDCIIKSLIEFFIVAQAERELVLLTLSSVKCSRRCADGLIVRKKNEEKFFLSHMRRNLRIC